MRRNRLRELLNAGQPTLGTHLHISWPSVTELVGYAGHFDYVEFVAEYAPYDLYALENLGRAISVFDHLTGMMKIEQEPRNYLTIRALGSGIQNVLFADVRTAADAEACVRAVRAESPDGGGIHGVGMRRDVRFTIEPGSQGFVDALNQTVIAVMIEKKSAIENLDAILAVPGIDMVQFGPADYAMSLGLAGQWGHPQVQEAERYLIETALKRGIHPRAEIQHPGQARRYLDLGVRHFCVGTDMVTLWQWFKETGTAMRGLVGGESGARPADENAHSGYQQ
ncbi:MAG: aldolase/citrate lyase family protein [Thermomicrobiales bacterium]